MRRTWSILKEIRVQRLRLKKQVHTRQRQDHTRWMPIYTKQNQGGLNIAIHVRASNREEIVREVCIQLILVKASLEGRAVFPMQRTTKTCNVKSMNWKGNCATHSEDIYRPTPSCPLRRQMVLVIDEELELRPARFSPTTRSITIDVDIRARLAKA